VVEAEISVTVEHCRENMALCRGEFQVLELYPFHPSTLNPVFICKLCD